MSKGISPIIVVVAAAEVVDQAAIANPHNSELAKEDKSVTASWGCFQGRNLASMFEGCCFN